MSIQEILGTDVIKDSRAVINDNFAFLDGKVGGSNTQLQYNNAGQVAGARIAYTEIGARNNLQAINTNGNIELQANGTGYASLGNGGFTSFVTALSNMVYIESGNAEVYTANNEFGAYIGGSQILQLTNNEINFVSLGGNSYRFWSGAGSLRGILDFSDIATSNKTFTFPNVSGNIQVATTGLGERKKIHKPTDEIVNNSATLQDDDHLLFTIGANETWSFTFFARTETNNIAKIKYRWSFPAGASMQGFDAYSFYFLDESGHFDIAPGNVPGISTTGVVVNGGTAGAVNFRWAQEVATVFDTKVLKGSYIIAERLA